MLNVFDITEQLYIRFAFIIFENPTITTHNRHSNIYVFGFSDFDVTWYVNSVSF